MTRRKIEEGGERMIEEEWRVFKNPEAPKKPKIFPKKEESHFESSFVLTASFRTFFSFWHPEDPEEIKLSTLNGWPADCSTSGRSSTATRDNENMSLVPAPMYFGSHPDHLAPCRVCQLQRARTPENEACPENRRYQILPTFPPKNKKKRIVDLKEWWFDL